MAGEEPVRDERPGAVSNLTTRTYMAVLDQTRAKLGKSEIDVKRYTPLAVTQAIKPAVDSMTPSKPTLPMKPPWRPPGLTISSAQFFRRWTAWP